MSPFLLRAWRSDGARDLIEYGLLVAVITLAGVLAMTSPDDLARVTIVLPWG